MVQATVLWRITISGGFRECDNYRSQNSTCIPRRWSESTYLKKEVLQFQVSFGHVSRRGVRPLHLKHKWHFPSLNRSKHTNKGKSKKTGDVEQSQKSRAARESEESTNKCYLFACDTSVQTTRPLTSRDFLCPAVCVFSPHLLETIAQIFDLSWC